MDTENTNDWLTTTQVAERFHIAVATVRHLVYLKKLKPYRQLGQKENLFLASEVAEVLTPKPK